ncbi:flagellar biosynthetic protein FliO [Halomonas sp. PAMB 3264]|uniref:flagellar biosynthetic protein FliO n=1 Tax=unclassified Halomonas TaxID=2609666 RepID=UPI0028A08E2C|nr:MULTISPECIES: flagellar biosynthetic protein FliO [unclassified Halomonas]WNL38857.1 flagellar biosynthetic protein FliO [Halomonas sp. PAMB 3232]WNL42196.1 flagellar biosynthetic protein FliO [Halomonas sp. PAMB 3264]
MSVAASTHQAGSIDALGSDALMGMATLGKTAAALALVIAIILLCTALLKRVQQKRFDSGARLKVVGSTAVGARERIVVVELEDTWLVVGVGGGRITKLHERAAPIDRPTPEVSVSTGFSKRLAKALSKRSPPTSEPPSSS